MPRNFLLTGGSGYRGGTLLAQLKKTKDLPSHGTIYALVRNEDQAEKVKSHYGAIPLTLDLEDQATITATLLEKKISVVFFLINAYTADTQLKLIEALSAVKAQLSIETHFLHTTGAKLFSSFTGQPTDRVLSDADEGVYEIQKGGKSPFPPMETAVGANNKVTEAGEKHGVSTYIYIPCIVYGDGSGFGNRISIQTVAIVKAAKALRQVIDLEGAGCWPVCHVDDSAALYIDILRNILSEKAIGQGRKGYYLAAAGSIEWSDLYKQMAKALAKSGAVDDDGIHRPSDQSMEAAAKALGCPKEFVPVEMGGSYVFSTIPVTVRTQQLTCCHRCTLQADRGRKIGWTPKYPAQHLSQDAENEVQLILSNI